MYRRGATHRQLAARYGVDEATIRRHVAGLVESRRTGPRRRPVTDEQIVSWRDSGLSWAQVAANAAMSPAGVRKRYAVATTGARPWD